MFSITDFPAAPIPGYGPTGGEEVDFSNVNDELPSYDTPGPFNLREHTSRRLLHEFTLEGSDKRPWATVRFRSWAPSTKSLPIFLNGQEVSGHVILDLRQPESIKGVEFSVSN